MESHQPTPPPRSYDPVGDRMGEWAGTEIRYDNAMTEKIYRGCTCEELEAQYTNASSSTK